MKQKKTRRNKRKVGGTKETCQNTGIRKLVETQETRKLVDTQETRKLVATQETRKFVETQETRKLVEIQKTKRNNQKLSGTIACVVLRSSKCNCLIILVIGIS